MAWTAPRTWTTGELVTKTILDTHIRDNEIYLKTAVDAAVLRAGDTMAGTLQTSVNIGMRHTDDAGWLEFLGGPTYPAGLALYGKDNGTYPGGIRALVPNAAKTAYVEAFRFSGATDTPEMVAGVIPMARLQKYELGSYQGDGSGATRQITTGFTASFLSLFGLDFSDADANETVWTSFTAVASIYQREDGVIARSTNVHLHNTDGFSVGDANNEGNKNGVNYYYLVLG